MKLTEQEKQTIERYMELLESIEKDAEKNQEFTNELKRIILTTKNKR